MCIYVLYIEVQSRCVQFQVLRVENEGRIHVLWADKTTSFMLPQNLFVVDTEVFMSSILTSVKCQDSSVSVYVTTCKKCSGCYN